MGAPGLLAAAVLTLLLCTAAAATSGPVATEAALRAAVASGGTVTLTAPITLTGGELVLSSVLSIDGAERTIDGGGNSRIFNVKAGGSLFASALTFNNAKANGSGGAMLVAGTVALDNPVFISNQAVGVLSGGGAIAVIGSSGSLTVRGGRFEGNSANFGGAIDVESGAKADIGYSTFTNNKAVTSGGAIQALDRASLLLSEEDDTVAPGTPNFFMGNVAPLGGAVMIDQAVAQICGFRGTSNTASTNGPNIYQTAGANSSITFFDFPATVITTAPGGKAPLNQPFLGCPPLSALTPAPTPAVAPATAPAPAAVAPAPAPAPAPIATPLATVATVPPTTVSPVTPVPTTPATTAPAPTGAVAPAPATPPVATPVVTPSPTPLTTTPLPTPTPSSTLPPTSIPSSTLAPTPTPSSTLPPTSAPSSTIPPTGAPVTTAAPPVNPCRNGGTPFVISGQTGCQCPNGYTGARCEVPIFSSNPYTTF